MRLAHFSDVHVTHFPLSGGLALKRLAAVASYSLMGRGAHFKGSEERIAALLADVDAQRVDHALCTGDLTGVATEKELARAAELFGERRSKPREYTVIPGNHDRYTTSANGRFEHHFSGLCEGGRFPFVKNLEGDVTLLCVDSARPTSVIDSSGLLGAAQLAAVKDVLTDRSLRGRFVILALHYGLLRMDGKRDRPNHGLRDDAELLALIDRDDVTLDLVLHGHLHRSFRIRTKRRLIVNAGSATDLHTACGYNVYDIDAAAHRVRIERREWSAASNTYVTAPHAPVAGDVRTAD